MPAKFSFFILILVSAAAGTGLWFLAAGLMYAGGSGKAGSIRPGGYAVLSVDEAFEDRQIRTLLTGEDVISESSQWVFLDDFGALEKVPLDEYPSRITPFDPRNDGYAEKLHSFFVRSGKRLFFIPLNHPARLEKELSVLLDDIPFSLETAGFKQPVLPYLILIICSGLCALALSRRLLPLAPALAALVSLAFCGISGLALAGIFVFLACLLEAPCGELFTLLRYHKANFRKIRSGLEPDRMCVFLVPVFLTGGVIAAVSGGIHPLLLLAVFFGFFGIFVLSLWVFFRRGDARDHIRFAPVPITKMTAKTLTLSQAILPYTFSSLLVLLLSPFFAGAPSPERFSFAAENNIVITEEEYRSHADFQASFSFRPLDSESSGRTGAGYARYTLGDDGLISGEAAPVPPLRSADIPPFPLEDLMGFFGAIPQNPSHRTVTGAWGIRNIIPALLALLFSVPALFRFRWGDKKGKSILPYKEKRIAA
ncbi:MAG: hypothetical protein LBN21_13135 [Treponema sp.]|jgi:hypothetical protein|nr:hypothetical protein [Treponema sp.]